jgi:DNA-binding MarR family transcriptional regulator
MNNDLNIWLERLASLHKSQMRKAAAEEKVQLVHLEILHYLSICNKYSNTAQALSEYLGQTKGSISQSLKFIEQAEHIERRPCIEDRRVIRLLVTPKGRACYQRMEKKLMPHLSANKQALDSLQSCLAAWQSQNGLKGFGQCKSCQHNKIFKQGNILCNLTQEALTISDTQKICREFIFNVNSEQ